MSADRTSVVRASVDVNHVGHEPDCTARSANQVEFSLDMKSLLFTRIQRAKSVTLNGQHLFLKECAKCGSDFYGIEKQTRCDECAGKRRKRAS